MPEFEIIGGDNQPEKKESGKKGNKVTKLLKKKPFLIAVGVVVVLGLYAWYRNTQVAQADGQNMILADGMGMVGISPETVASSYDDGTADMMYDFMLEMAESFENQMTDFKSSYDVQIDEMSSQISTFSNRLNTQATVIEAQADTIAMQNDIQAMQNNSDMWHYATTDERKNALSEANQKIASKWGWTFDSKSGYWFDSSGNRLYTTATQEQNNPVSSSVPVKTASTSSSGSSVSISTKPGTIVNAVKNNYGSGSSGSGFSSTASDIAKMKANSQAWHNASDSEKTALHNQNKAIAQKNNWTFNSQTGSYYDSSGKKVY